MVEKKTWNEFRDSGLLWWINSLLHLFGWAIVCDMEGEEVINVYPARVKFRGFSEESNTEGYQKVTKFLAENSESLLQETIE